MSECESTGNSFGFYDTFFDYNYMYDRTDEPATSPLVLVHSDQARRNLTTLPALGIKAGVKSWFRRCLDHLIRLGSDPRRAQLHRALILSRLVRAYLYDCRRFARAAHLTDPFRTVLRRGLIYCEWHTHWRKVRRFRRRAPGFGSAKIRSLLHEVQQYQSKFGCDEVSFATVGVLRGIQHFHARTGHFERDWEIALSTLEDAEIRAGRPASDGIPNIQLTRAEIQAALPQDPEAFFWRRCSVRQFERGSIDRGLLERAIRLAQKAPSVCNRQSARVLIYTDPDEMRIVLKHQDGNAGFGHDVAAVMVVTSDLSCFYKDGERNQAFVDDGGMFAVSLVYALHSLGLGSCLLNWSRDPREDTRNCDASSACRTTK